MCYSLISRIINGHNVILDFMKAKKDGAIKQFVLIKWCGAHSTQWIIKDALECALRCESSAKNTFKFCKCGYNKI